MLQGHMAIASAAFEPDASGAIQSSRPNHGELTRTRAMAFGEKRVASRGCAGRTRSHSCFATICAAAE